MAIFEEHYENVLSDVYVWMFDGFDSGVERNIGFFQNLGIKPIRSGLAVDLGAGCGFQSIPLAQKGFSVTAIDLDTKLLDVLTSNVGELPVKIVRDDLVDFNKHIDANAELIVCMTDTIIHLESKDRVISLFEKVVASLEDGGKFIITFRDLSCELSELDRFISVKSDSDIIFTCFLEYEPEKVKVHDLVYMRKDSQWCLSKSFYRKLRLSKEWVDEQLLATGFSHIESTVDRGFVAVIANK